MQMAEYISKELVLDYLKGCLRSMGDCEADSLFDIGQRRTLINSIQDISATKAADVQPVKRGKWLHFNSDGIIFCSECKHEAYWDTDYGQQLFDYCPYCGARMDLKDGDTE